MALFGLFGGKKKGYASPWLQLTAVYVTALEGLAPDHAFALRGIVIAARPIEFDFIVPGSFLAFYPGTPEGLQSGQRLADSMRDYARGNALTAFGAGVQQGECLAQLSASGRFAGKPKGAVISEAMNQALREAGADATA